MNKQVPERMSGVWLTGHGGFEKLTYQHDIPVPKPKPQEVLIQVMAAGINNTDINTRTAWYSKSVQTGTQSGGATGFSGADDEDGSWSGTALQFPRIQGADVCGIIVAVGSDVDEKRLGERVLVRNMLRSYVDYRPYECWTLGSECDGGFAQYTVAPAQETHAVHSDYSDAELAAVPCAYSTAEGMLQRAQVRDGDRVLITGASGGVGSAAVQLAKCRGAHVIAVAGADKQDRVKSLGADDIVVRGNALTEYPGADSVNVVIDLVAGSDFPSLLSCLQRGGRYAVAGAIAGPLVELDVRTLYLKDLSFFGCTFQEDCVFENVIRLIEAGQIRPLVAQTYPLSEIVQAQKDFLGKQFTGKLVLIPPQD